jgi:hypothetical protein
MLGRSSNSVNVFWTPSGAVTARDLEDVSKTSQDLPATANYEVGASQ